MDRLPCNLDYTKPHILYESKGRQTEQREAIHSAELPGGVVKGPELWSSEGKQDMCGGTDYFGMSWSRDEIRSVIGNCINEFFLLTGRWDQSSISKSEITEGNNVFTARHSRQWWLLRYQRLLLALHPHVTRIFSAVTLSQTSLGPVSFHFSDIIWWGNESNDCTWLLAACQRLKGQGQELCRSLFP